MNDNQFIHRPISLKVDSIGEMETARVLPAAQTRVTVNAKMDRATAKALALHLLEKLMTDQPVDLITFHMNGTLK